MSSYKNLPQLPNRTGAPYRMIHFYNENLKKYISKKLFEGVLIQRHLRYEIKEEHFLRKIMQIRLSFKRI